MNSAMYWAARICNELDVAQAASTRASHLLEGQLDGVAASEKRSWGEYFQEKGRELGVAAALVASAVGLSGFGERRAEAGLILSASQGGNDAAYRSNGAARVIDNGGVQGWFSAEYDSFTGSGRTTSYSTAFAYTPTDIALCSHQIVPYLNRNTIFQFGTGSNFNTNRGTVFDVTNVITVPGYVNGSSRSTVQDLAVGHLGGQISNLAVAEFASSRPATGETLTFAGFGTFGTTDIGLVGQDGAIRYGTTFASGSNPLGGASPQLYLATQTLLTGSLAFANAATNGDSGSILLDSLNQIVGSVTHASVNPLTGVAAALDYTRPDAQAFLRANQSFTSVPEPSSLVLAVAPSMIAAYRLRRKSIKSISRAASNRN